MTIVRNKKATHDFFIEEKYEAGIVLHGWEIKAIRNGRTQLRDSYVKIKDGEVWLLGMHISPLSTASTHVIPVEDRLKKLLLNRREINKLIGKIEQKGYSLIALDLHFSKGNVKVNLGLGKGKKEYDKRNVIKDRENKIESARMLKNFTR